MNPASLMNISHEGAPEVITKYISMEAQNGGGSEQLHSELEAKDNMLKNEQIEKDRLKEQLESLQHVIGKQSTQTEKDKKELERMKKLKEKLKVQKKKDDEWNEERKKRE